MSSTSTSQSGKVMMAPMGMIVLARVVFARLHTVGAEDVGETGAAVGPRLHPCLHCFEHAAMRFVVHVPQRRVVEDPDAVVQDLLLRYVGMIPGVQDARRGVLENRCRYVSGGLVEDVGEVVL